MGMWPSKLLAEMPADEYAELMAMAQDELFGLDRTDYLLAQIAAMNAAGGSLVDFMPYTDPLLLEAIDRVLNRGDNDI